jgi:proteasome lid subunit RPN8/RPN11
MLCLRSADYYQMRRHGEETYPHECCGVMLGSTVDGERHVTAVVRCRNTRNDSPRNRYSIDPPELVRVQREARERGVEIVGFYHSHPDHPAQCSQTDFEEAHWIGCSYVITSVEQGRATVTRAFALSGTREEDKKFAEEEISVE